jgi:carboxypeptidase Taq
VSVEAQYEELKARLSEIWDLTKAVGLLSWDYQTMMPPGGAAVRGDQLGTLSKIVHERFASDEIGRLLDDLREWGEAMPYDSDEASLIRVARRDWEKERRVPGELREEMTRAGAEAFHVWVEARRRSDFGLFLPRLRHNVELRRRYIDCFDVDEPYDALLDDFEPEMKTAEVRSVFERLKEGLVPLIAAAADQDVDDSCLRGHFPVEAQRALDSLIVERFGFETGTWRIDPTEHPFASSMSTQDIRLTTRHPEHELVGLFATMHESGHGLYEHGVARTLERTPLCRGASLSLHESQSRMWENLVGRSRAFWRGFYPRLQRVFPEQLGEVDVDTFYRAINKVKPSLIRIQADEATYSLHIILRFELEQQIIEDELELEDLPDAWNARMEEYLGVAVPDDAHGVLQDVHWARGSMGYFPTYALGNVISVQIWERVLADIPDLADRIEQGELAPLREWLRERLHRHGRKFTPPETLERVVGGGLDPEPYLSYLGAKLAEPAPA